MADTESHTSNGVVSDSGDGQVTHDGNSGILNTSGDKGYNQQAAGDGLSNKRATSKLTRIPTITINDEDDNETVLNDSNSEIMDNNKGSEEVSVETDLQSETSSQNNDLEIESMTETSTENEKISIVENESESRIPSLNDADKVNKSVPENETNKEAACDEVKNDSEKEVNSEDVNGDNSVVEETSEQTEEERDNPDEPLDILGNGLLLKKVNVLGGKEITRPVYGQQVTLRTEGFLEGGSVVDKNDSIQFTLGDGDVIQAWDICTALMGMGETCQLTTDAKYAYGAVGRSPDVPPNSKITYTLELLKKEDPVDIDKLSVEERIAYGDQKRERGNYLFGRNDYTGAINSYSRALKILNDEKCSLKGEAKLLQGLLDMRLKCYNNIAAAQLKVDAFDAAIKSCDEVLKVQPENVKALFRKGKSYAAKGQTELSITVLKKTLKLDPGSKIVQQELFKQTKKLNKETASEKEMYKKMFGTASPPDSDKKKNIWKSWGLWATGALAVILLSVGIAAYRH